MKIFEALFWYPLGVNERFRIDHSPDYRAFYQAMGPSHTWVVLLESKVVATLSVVLRPFYLQGRSYSICYVGDLKIHPDHQSGRILMTLVKAVQPFVTDSAHAAYGLVMDGTRVTPDRYTGRLGIPAFKPLSKRFLLRLETFANEMSCAPLLQDQEGHTLYKELMGDGFYEIPSSATRSLMVPQWLSCEDLAVGKLEDTRRAKRLYGTTGHELVSAHLSYFAFRQARAGYQVLQSALVQAHVQNYPALFVALSQEKYELLEPYLRNLSYTVASVTLYATDKICGSIPVETADI